MHDHNDNKIVAKFAKETYVSHIVKLLKLTNPNKVLPINNDLYDIEDKINKCTSEFVDSDDCSTVALTSNPSSFSSNISAEELFSFEPNKFNLVSLLGRGSFGRVFLSEYESRFYAIKMLPKNKIQKDQVAQIMAEKQILLSVDSPFVLKLYGTCQSRSELYFVTEVLENGDLYQAIYGEDRLNHEECVFYGASIVLALDFLHNKKIVYRDLKPENIMIGPNGYPKIIDFGLAKQLPYSKTEGGITSSYTKCYTLCGTPEYVSPEIILGKEYDSAVDVWALGILLYEMINKRTPFVEKIKDADFITRIFTNIVLAFKHGIDISNKIDKKTDGTDNARNLITQLLSGDKTNRLGPGNSPSVLLNHPYFLSTNINSDDLYNQSIPAPTIQPEFVGSDIENEKEIEEYTGEQDLFSEF